MKQTYYFQHDYNAHKDPKCSALINDLGTEGYGVYWALIEILHEQGGKLKKFPKLWDGIAFELRVEKDKLVKQIEAMVRDYELLVEDDNFIWSERVLRNFEERNNKYNLKAEAGRIGGIKSGISRKIMKQNEALLEANELNKIKENKIKENKIKENNIIESSQRVDSPSKIADSFLNDINSSYRASFLEKFGKSEEVKKEMIKFISYWTEPNKSGTKQRWQTEKTFEIGRRLTTWFNRLNNFNQSRFVDLSNL